MSTEVLAVSVAPKVVRSEISYRTIKMRIHDPDPRLFELQRQAAHVYNETLKAYWGAVSVGKEKPNKFIAMSTNKFIESDLHSHSKQLATKGFYQSLKSFFELRKSFPSARPPLKEVRFRSIEWDETGISVKNKSLHLSLSKGNPPIVIPWRRGEPKTVKIVYDGLEACYFLCATFSVGVINLKESGLDDKVAGIDLGEIHLVAYASEDRVVILNGRGTRSRRQYKNKAQAKLTSRIDRARNGSRRHRKLVLAKRKMLRKVSNQLKDDVHKTTHKVVQLAKEEKIDTLVIGDIRTLRVNNRKGKKVNQKVHQAPFGKVRSQLTYKALAEGMRVELQNEAWTSQTCLACGGRTKPKGRIYECPCGFTYHRDALGSVGIRQKYLKKIGVTQSTSVVGVLAPPIVGINPLRSSNSSSGDRLAGNSLECLSEKPRWFT